MRFLYAIFDGIRYAFARFGFLGRLARVALPIEFVGGWFASRRYREFLYGIPALLTLFSLLGFAVFSYFFSEPKELAYYTQQANAARANGADEVANLYLRKAASAQAGSPRDRLGQAYLLLEANQNPQAMDILQELAPSDGGGYVPARLLVVDRLGKQLSAVLKDEKPDQEQMQAGLQIVLKIKKQCELILEQEPTNEVALEKLIDISMRMRSGEQALTYAEALSEQRPQINILVAQLFQASGRVDEAKTAASRAINALEPMLEKEDLNPQQRKNLRINLASVYSIHAEHEKAVNVLLENRELPNDPQLRQAMGGVFFSWSDSIPASFDVNAETSEERLTQKLDLLGKALKLVPNNPQVLNRIAAIASTKGEAGQRARSGMKKILASGNASAVVHFVLGVGAVMDGDLDASLKHMELANRASPSTPVTLNNLAFLMAQRESPDLPKALKLINQAIQLRPEVAEFYDTRGGIYLAQKEWSKAVTDFQKALQGKAGDEQTLHTLLAQAYTELGMSELADIHTEKSADLKAKK